MLPRSVSATWRATTCADCTQKGGRPKKFDTVVENSIHIQQVLMQTKRQLMYISVQFSFTVRAAVPAPVADKNVPVRL
jgi:hypothetical protein